MNENADPTPRDMLHALRTLIPQIAGMGFHHGEENSDAHIKASLQARVPFPSLKEDFC